MTEDPSREAPWFGWFRSSDYPDMSKGVNPRYGKSRPLKSLLVEGRFKDLKVGDILHILWYKKYQHGASMRVTKFNRKTLSAIEIKRSYQPGTKWTIHPNFEIRISEEYNSNERLQELANKWN